MTSRKSKARAPSPAIGVKDFVAAAACERRKTQKSLTEIRAHAPTQPRNDLAPALEQQFLSTDELIPAAREIRRRDAAQNARIKSSIARFGICRPLLISADRRIIEGHGVWEAAKALAIPKVPCIVIDHLDEIERRMLRIALNRVAETGAWDEEGLQLEFNEMISLGEDLVVTGFETVEIDSLLLEYDDAGGDSEPALIPPKTSVSQVGDVWVLGAHRLTQGDAREPEVYARLLVDGEIAALVLTDEPFNVPNVGHVTGNTGHREFAMANGEMTREEFRAFNCAWIAAVMAYVGDGGLIATFIDWRSVELVIASGREAGLALLNLIVWAKSNGGQGSLWRSQHELLPVFKKGDAPHINNVELGKHGRWRSNVWTYPGASSLGSDARDGLGVHPTTKPRALLEDALLDVTNRGDIVIDCFAGSGSTLVAAEAVGRRCRAIELDGPYCDVIILRWQAMTDGEAILEATGETFAETLARREREGEQAEPAPPTADRDANSASKSEEARG